MSRVSEFRRLKARSIAASLCAFGLIALFGHPLKAAVTTYSNRSSWLASSSNVTTINFSGLAPTGGYKDFTAKGQLNSALSIAGVEFLDNTSGNADDALWVVDPRFNSSLYDWNSGSVLRGPGKNQFSAGSNLSVYLPPGTVSVALDLMTVAPFGDNVQIYLSGPGDVVFVQTASFPTRKFVGFTSSVPIVSMSIAAAGNPLVDDFAFGSAQQAPVANFSWSPNPQAGQDVQFTDTSTNAPTSWSWTRMTRRRCR
jgi:PKD repeat protein